MSVLMSDGRIEEKPQPDPSLPFLRLAFRPFFFLGALFSILSLALWVAILTGNASLDVYGGGLWWHMHEMLFGFVCAIVVGFLLTAVQTWTGVPGIKGTALGCLVLLWLAGRASLLLQSWLPGTIIVFIDMAFLPVAALVLARSVVLVRQWRNIVFVPLLLAMAAANGGMHWAATSSNSVVQNQAGTLMVMLVTLLMTIMAGRVVPMFTANGSGTERVAALTWLEWASPISVLLAVLTAAGVLPLSGFAAAAVFLAAAAVHALRVFRWRFRVTLGIPLLWSLHLSYWCIPIGLALYGLNLLGAPVTHSQAVHALAVGAMGMMILAMISRVSLGHTGRPLKVGRIMACAFLAMFMAFGVRVFGVYLADYYVEVITLAAVCWGLAYGCFVAVYLPVLTRPRLDGRPG